MPTLPPPGIWIQIVAHVRSLDVIQRGAYLDNLYTPNDVNVSWRQLVVEAVVGFDALLSIG